MRDWRFTVEVSSVPTSDFNADAETHYRSRHISAAGAARRLAEITNGKTARALDARPGMGRHGRYLIWDMNAGCARSLSQHRLHFGVKR